MEIVKDSFVNTDGAYYKSGGLIQGTQRILNNHPTIYWQQANIETKFAIDVENINVDQKIPEAIYIGRIPTHFGHFIMEGMARLCDVINLNKPIIGYITNGFLPEGIKPTPMAQIRWIIKSSTNQKFFEIKENETFLVETLYVPTLPYHLSHSCSEPWRMTEIIKKIVQAARIENNYNQTIDKYYLRRYDDLKDDSQYEYSDPNEILSKQIVKISYANELYGTVGSNTHLSIFAKNNAKTHWIPRGNYQEGDRNQLICDLIKTYNHF